MTYRIPAGLVNTIFSALMLTTQLSADQVPVFERGSEGYNVYRIPALIRAGNGDLLAFCEARESGDASEIDLVMKRSSDGGMTWSSLQVVQSREAFRDLYKPGREITVGNPAPVVDSLDPQHPSRVWLPFTIENDRVFVTFSDDNGIHWSKAREITVDVKRDDWGWYATGPVHSIQIRRGPHTGRLVVPCDHRIGTDGADKGALGAHVIYSDDHGQTWKLGAVDDTYDDGLNANETTVAELPGGELYFNTRDQNGSADGTRGAAFSRDGGLTFVEAGSTHRWFSPVTGVIDPPVVQCSVLMMEQSDDSKSSGLLLFCGPDTDGPSGPGRSDLRVRLSTDEAKTWRDGPLLHEGPAAYSDMVRITTEGDNVGILFECGDSGGGAYDRIAFTVLSTSDLPLKTAN